MSESTIIDNQGENTLQVAIEEITAGSKELSIATAFFSLDALAIVAKNLHSVDRVRILFGDDADRIQRAKLLDRLRETSDRDLAEQRLVDPTLESLSKVHELFNQKKIEARCYTKKKFHAKAYISDLHEQQGRTMRYGIIGSGNFTRPGLTRNLELNVDLTKEQTRDLKAWYEARWEEAVEDDVTDIVEKEIKRQIDLYDPYSIYVKALLSWGDWVQGRDQLPPLGVLSKLDPHQEDAFRQAIKILDRENGVLICDGVGLGKSFVALALMEHFLSKGKNAFLIAPKAILSASWEGYLRTYLNAYRRGYRSLVHEPMTWFGFNAEKDSKGVPEKQENLMAFSRQAEVVIIDESHNFRKMDSQRYENLLMMLSDGPLGPKKVILLTATPINTEYVDLTSQFRLITKDKGTIGGVAYETYRKHAVALDGEHRKKEGDQYAFDYQLGHQGLGFLEKGMDAIAIQRSRKTCKELAAAKGKQLRFPDREPIKTIGYLLSPLYKNLVKHTEAQFKELARFLRDYQIEVRRAAAEKDETKRKLKLKLPDHGLRFSAYLPDRYRIKQEDSLREAQVESFLVSLVFTNVMKQLESSPVAFQGILQALGAGLCARLHHVAEGGDLPQDRVADVIAEHTDWIGIDVRKEPFELEDVDEDAVAADASGEEMDEWLSRALRVRSVQKGLFGFGMATHHVDLWRKHIETDLSILKDIHSRTLQARGAAPDRKMEEVVANIRAQRERGRKVLVFTQSKRTADYLLQELQKSFGAEVERIDASIQGDRRVKILHSFSPKYNPMLEPPLDFEPVNILISTDVLSEGVNLQEAGCILNYDIHWNPVRLIQRIGRVDRRLNEDDPGHTFAIMNVVPPKEIEEIIELVGTVEGRKRKITSLLGLDQAFFSSEDPEGTLREFNKMVEGEVSARDEALKVYDQLLAMHPDAVERADAAPDGAFGVWRKASVDGVFAMFVMKASDKTTEQDHAKFAHVIGMPVVSLKTEDRVSLDAAEVLQVLACTTPGERSADPIDPKATIDSLAKLKKAVNESFRPIGLVASIQPHLVCCMELKRDA